MPYSKLSELPQSVRANLPHHAQEIYKEAFNSALESYRSPNERRDLMDDPEIIAHKVAWSAVKKKFTKDESTGKWLPS